MYGHLTVIPTRSEGSRVHSFSTGPFAIIRNPLYLANIAITLHPELGDIEDFPWDADVLAKCEPVYVTLPGWKEETPKSGHIKDLPENARKYIAALETHTGTKVMWVGTGPGREEMLKA